MAPRETDVKTWHNINPHRFSPPPYSTSRLGNHSLSQSQSTSCNRICSPAAWRSRWWRPTTSCVTNLHCSLRRNWFRWMGFFGQFPMVLRHLLDHCQGWMTFSLYSFHFCGYLVFGVRGKVEVLKLQNKKNGRFILKITVIYLRSVEFFVYGFIWVTSFIVRQLQVKTSVKEQSFSFWFLLNWACI